MTCIYNCVDIRVHSFDVIIPYTHSTAHVIILPLEINYNNYTLHYSPYTYM